jgi:DNA-binding IclR family transcriptional regulator
VNATAHPAGCQTLLRGLDILDQLADGPIGLLDLAKRLGLTRSTTHRLATALTDRGFLLHHHRQGYRLGSKLLQLGFLAQAQLDLVHAARPHITALAATTEDTVHLGRLDGDLALYLDKVPGQRKIDVRTQIGDRHPLTRTGLGRALLLDAPIGEWRRLYDVDRPAGEAGDFANWAARMKAYATAGRALDLAENEDRIRCVAAPIRDVSDRIVAAISVSSAAHYMDDARMRGVEADVLATAHAISADLGWRAAQGDGRGPRGARTEGRGR